MRLSALAPVLLLGTLAAGCVGQRTHVYSSPSCYDYDCGPSFNPAGRFHGYGGRPGYGGYPGYRGGVYLNAPYSDSPAQIGYNPTTCSEC